MSTINQNSHEWGVSMRYGTPSEYLDAVLQASTTTTTTTTSTDARRKQAPSVAPTTTTTTFPVAKPNTSFFPYQDWSGYFTSRPYLKQLSRDAHIALAAAEIMYTRSLSTTTTTTRQPSTAATPSPSAAEATSLWSSLELARRNAAILQHHDAITGTFCAASEGCPGTDQDVGSHDVLGSYTDRLVTSIASSHHVFEKSAEDELARMGWLKPQRPSPSSLHTTYTPTSTATSSSTPATPTTISLDPTFAGNLLLGQGDGGDGVGLFVFNPMPHAVMEVIRVPVPVCAVTVRAAANTTTTTTAAASRRSSSTAASARSFTTIVPSQTTAALDISDRTPPYYAFTLTFTPPSPLPPLSWSRFLIEPVPFARRHCVSSSDYLPKGASTPVHHTSAFTATTTIPPPPPLHLPPPLPPLLPLHHPQPLSFSRILIGG